VRREANRVYGRGYRRGCKGDGKGALPGRWPGHGGRTLNLNNDAGKLSRLMVATRKYKETYDMQASRRGATWFNTHKPVVNNYALGILVLRSQYLLKVLTSIASWNLTVTDP
jgi:hypothetical protein